MACPPPPHIRLPFGYRGEVHERVRRGSRLLAAAALLSFAPRVGDATAAPEAPDALIGGTSTCPSPAALRAELEALVPRDRLDAKLRAIGGSTPPVELVDRGAPFRVMAAGRVREYRDEARDCAYRARVAAVFVALVIEPAAILPARPDRTATVIKAPAAVPGAPLTPLAAASSTTSRSQSALDATLPSAPFSARARLELGAAVEGGWGPDTRVGVAGLALRLAAGGGRVALVAGSAALGPVDTTVGGVRLHQWRLPADLGVRVQGRLGYGGRPLAAPFGEVGAGAALLRESALDLAARQTRSTLELGLRAAVGVRLATSPSARLTPFLIVHAMLVPSPPTVFALPQGTVGSTPRFWIGAAAGASWGFL